MKISDGLRPSNNLILDTALPAGKTVLRKGVTALVVKVPGYLPLTELYCVRWACGLINAAARSVMAATTGDLQGFKATMVCAFLGGPWTDFQNDEAPVTKAIYEIVTNVLEK